MPKIDWGYGQIYRIKLGLEDLLPKDNSLHFLIETKTNQNLMYASGIWMTIDYNPLQKAGMVKLSKKSLTLSDLAFEGLIEGAICRFSEYAQQGKPISLSYRNEGPVDVAIAEADLDIRIYKNLRCHRNSLVSFKKETAELDFKHKKLGTSYFAAYINRIRETHLGLATGMTRGTEYYGKILPLIKVS